MSNVQIGLRGTGLAAVFVWSGAPSLPGSRGQIGQCPFRYKKEGVRRGPLFNTRSYMRTLVEGDERFSERPRQGPAGLDAANFCAGTGKRGQPNPSSPSKHKWRAACRSLD